KGAIVQRLQAAAHLGARLVVRLRVRGAVLGGHGVRAHRSLVFKRRRRFVVSSSNAVVVVGAADATRSDPLVSKGDWPTPRRVRATHTRHTPTRCVTPG